MAVVLITGCSSGIGLATARHFARLGDEVHAGVRHPSTAWELTAAIESDKLKIAPLTLDVDDDASVRRGVQEVIARSGRIDALVNNAGIGGGGPIQGAPVPVPEALVPTHQLRNTPPIPAPVPRGRGGPPGALPEVSSLPRPPALAPPP